MSATSDRHYLTVVFSDLSNSVKLSSEFDPEIADQVQSQVRELATKLAEMHDGVVNQFYGDGMLVLFGMPAPQESDSVRALEFTLALHNAVDDLPRATAPADFQIRLHSGVAAGLVSVRAGDLEVGKFAVSGEPPNRANRLSSMAQPGEIYFCSDSLGRARYWFDHDRLGKLELRGISSPIEVCRVDAEARRHDAQTFRERFNAPFVGRENALSKLSSVLACADSGTISIANVVGPAGIGKTRLIQHFLKARVGSKWLVLRAYADEQLSRAPLACFRTLIDALPEHDRDKFQANPQLADETAQMADKIASLAATVPIVLFIDDWQWTDDASRQVLERLTSLSRKTHLMFIVTTRENRPGDPVNSGETIELIRLDPASAQQAISQLTPAGLAPRMVQQLLDRSGGNPLHIEEMCQSLPPESWMAPQLSQPLPIALSKLIEAKLAKLTAYANRCAAVAAVVGLRCPAWILTKLDLLQGVAELSHSDVAYLDANGTNVIFKHGATQEVIYSLIGPKERSDLHQLIAELLLEYSRSPDGEELTEALAYHYSESGNATQTIQYAVSAGNHAQALSALDQARLQYRRALTALAQLERSEVNNRQWLQLSKRWALASTYSPSSDCIKVLMEALQRASDDKNIRGMADANYFIGWIYYALGDQQKSIEYSEVALEQANEINFQPLAAQLLTNIGQAHAAAGQYHDGSRFLDRGISAIEYSNDPTASPIGWAYAKSCKAFVVADQGDFDEAHALMAQSLDSLKGLDNPIEASILNMHTAIQLWQGQWQRAISDAERVQQIAERFSLPYLFAMSRSIEAYASWQLHADSNAIDILVSTTDWLEASEMRLNFSLSCAWTSDVLADAGRLEEASHYADRALERATTGDRLGEAMSLRALAKIAAATASPSTVTAELYQRAYAAAAARNSAHERATTLLHEARLQTDSQANPTLAN